MRWLLVILVLLGAGGGAFVWLRPLPVTVARIAPGTAAEVVYAAGIVEPVRSAAIAAVARARIIDTCACEGEAVSAGAPILRLDDAAARAHLAELDAKVDLAEKALSRAESLLERRVISADRFDTAQALFLELSAARAAARAAIDELTLRAPLDGVVLRLDGEPGEVAEPGKPVAWVGPPRPLRIEADVNEEDIPRVRPGQPALIRADAFPGRVLAAEVATITPMGDADLRTYRVRLSLPDDTPLMIGMSVEVNIVIREEAGALLAPAAAVTGGQLQVVEDGVVRRRPVAVGIAGPETVQIVSGAAAGAVVVSPADPTLADGRRVRVQP